MWGSTHRRVDKLETYIVFLENQIRQLSNGAAYYKKLDLLLDYLGLEIVEDKEPKIYIRKRGKK